jgi:type VI protein secretion system component Hcp
MIVARFCEGKKSLAVGSCKIAQYDGQKYGWFPVESFNFGFIEEKEGEEKKPAPSNGPPRQGGPAQAGGGQRPPGGKRKDSDFSELSIEKQIDTATCYLMFLAMEERKTKRGIIKSQGGKARDLSADIHVLASVQVGTSEDRCIYPTIMIHLEAVNILGWEVRGSGDSRPTENVKLRYDRAAMVYCATSDGKTFKSYGPKGWDQTSNEGFDSGKFKWKDQDFKDFLPIGSKLIKNLDEA